MRIIVIESTGNMGHASANKVDSAVEEDDGDHGLSVRCQLDQALIRYYGYVLLGD